MIYDPMRPCSICNDLRHFKMKVNDAERIKMSLDRLLNSADVNFEPSVQMEHEMHQMYCRTHPHFMCGHCDKANENELWNIEEKIKEAAFTLHEISKLESVDEQKKAHIIHTCQDVLRGHYPQLAQLFFRR